MKVCHIITWSADLEYFINLGKGLTDRGISLMLGTLFHTGKETPEFVKENNKIEYFCLGAKSRKDFPRSIWKLSQLLRREKVEILQTHLWESNFVGLLAARIARTPLRIITRHHLDQTHLIGKRIPIEIDRWTAREAYKVVTVSNAVKDFMIAADHIDGNKIEVIHLGFDYDKFTAIKEIGQKIRDEFSFAEDDFIIGCIGNFFPTKGHKYLLEAVKKISPQIRNIKLFFVGSGGDQSELEEIIKTLEMKDKVVFAGYRTDVPACLNAMDLVVHPSLSEAFCQVLIETMAVGKPLISTDVGGAKEAIVNGKTGILIPIKDSEAIAKVISQIYFHPEFSQEMALAGQKSVREQFTIERMVNRQVECYEKWLNEVKMKKFKT
jgi:glycosyltransferase involved in cell wall biosynthesis